MIVPLGQYSKESAVIVPFDTPPVKMYSLVALMSGLAVASASICCAPPTWEGRVGFLTGIIHNGKVQISRVRHSVIIANHYSTLLYSTLLYSNFITLLYFTLLYFTLLYFTLLYFTLLYFTLLYFTFQ